jgi:hypothetical protein
MKEIIAFVRKNLLSDDLSVDEKGVNIVLIIGIVSSFAAMLVRIILRDKPLLILIIFGVTVSAVVLLYACNKFHIYAAAGWAAIIIISDVLFPAAYFFIGGMESSISAYFVLSMVLVFLLSHKKRFVILFLIHIILTAGCYLLEFYVPALVVSELSPYQQFVDHVQSFVVISLCVGGIINFQSWIYHSERKKSEDTEKEIIRQDELLHVINDAAQILLTSDTHSFESAIKKILGMVGRCSDVDRINVWKNLWKDGELYYALAYSWEAHESLAQSGMIFAYDVTMPEWKDKLFEGIPIAGKITNLSPTLRDRLLPSAIQSLFILPIFLQDTFWGFVSFDDCRNAREFPEEERGMLKSAAIMIANAVAHNDLEAEMREVDERIRIILDAAPLCCNFWD